MAQLKPRKSKIEELGDLEEWDQAGDHSESYSKYQYEIELVANERGVHVPIDIVGVDFCQL